MTELECYKAMLDGAKDACDDLRAENASLREAIKVAVNDPAFDKAMPHTQVWLEWALK